MKTWGDKRYRSLNYFLREKFGEKVMKISLDGGFSCPNRDGTVSSGGCIFCSERGSGDFAGQRIKSIDEQFGEISSMMNKKWKEGKYIAYFQAFTNTYADPIYLRKIYGDALKEDGVVGLAIATRPDCLGKEVLEVLEEFSERTFLWVELGLQTSDEKTAETINRGYSNEVYEEAVRNLNSPGIPVVTHMIAGLPGENTEKMEETVRYIVRNNSWGIKFHLLHLMKNTPLVKFHERGDLEFMEEEEYTDFIVNSIGILNPSMTVHRLTGDSPRDLLIGPQWSLKKWEILNSIDKKLDDRDTWQGKHFEY